MTLSSSAVSEHVLLVACEDLHLIKKFGKKGKGKGEFDGPEQVVSVNGELYITDCGNCRIQVFGQEGLTFVSSFEVMRPLHSEAVQALWCLCRSRWTVVCGV